MGDAWAIGFLRGMELRPDDWDMLDEDEVCEEAFELILRFASEAGAAAAADARARFATSDVVARYERLYDEAVTQVGGPGRRTP